MKTKISRLAFLFLLATATFAADRDADFYKVPKYKIGNVVNIVVTTATRDTHYNPEEKCDTFVMTPELARDFFSHARVVSRAHDLHSDISSCESEGAVEFSNGDKGHWTISRGGVGEMSISNDSAKDKLICLHCDKCEDWGL